MGQTFVYNTGKEVQPENEIWCKSSAKSRH